MAPAQMEVPMNAYEEKQNRRRARYEARASRAEAEANETSERARDMLHVIPPGQPILVGHHSEGRDRRFRAKIGDTFRKACDLNDKAEHYARKAQGVGTAGISSDDPEALDKLKKQLEDTEKSSEMMVAANKAIRSGKLDELPKIGFSAKVIAEITKGDYMGRKGFAPYVLSGNRANAARIKERIRVLEKNAAREDREEEGPGYTYREDTTENRVMFIFAGKPDAEIRDILKSHAFKWSPSRGAWVRQMTSNGLTNARWVREALDALDK